MVKVALLTGPATQAEIDQFLSDYTPSNGERSPPFFSCERDDQVDEPAGTNAFSGDYDDFKTDAMRFESAMSRQCKIIADHAPARGSKKDGTRSQKQLREMEHAKFKHYLAILARKHGIIGGAWMAYLNEDDIDSAWAHVVKELAGPKGRLAVAGAVYARVTSKRQSDKMPWILQVWVEDAFDVQAVEMVDRVLVECCGYAPSAFKTDAMSVLGITGQHTSKIPPSSYGRLAFMTRDELTAAKERFDSHGPADSISPLSGPPPEDPVDLDYVYVPDGTTGSTQPPLKLDEDGNIVVAPGSTPTTAAAAASSSSRVKRSSSSELTPCTSDDDDAAPAIKRPAVNRRKLPSSPTRGAGVAKVKKRKALQLDFHSSSHEGESDDDVLDDGGAPLDLKVKDFGAPTPGPPPSSSWTSRPKRKAALAARGKWAPEEKKAKASVKVEDEWENAVKQEEGE
ncbi:hypothetical protein JCM8208_003680 [Rhodotorula glutinis]